MNKSYGEYKNLEVVKIPESELIKNEENDYELVEESETYEIVSNENQEGEQKDPEEDVEVIEINQDDDIVDVEQIE